MPVFGIKIKYGNKVLKEYHDSFDVTREAFKDGFSEAISEISVDVSELSFCRGCGEETSDCETECLLDEEGELEEEE